jgi:hypothetical protein
MEFFLPVAGTALFHKKNSPNFGGGRNLKIGGSAKPITARSMDQISIKTPNPICRLFLKIPSWLAVSPVYKLY